MALISVKGAGFSYGSQVVFKDVNCAINDGEIFCIVGPNGCGKTTFLDCMLGLSRLAEGEILLEGLNIATVDISEIAKKVAYVPQSHEKTFPYMVREIVLMGRAAYTTWYGTPSEEDQEIADEALELVGLAHLKNKAYTQLSGGEGQLVMIARALAQQTQVIVMDEPTAHLDFRHEMNVLETIVRLARDENVAIVMATHFPNHAYYFENNLLNTTVALMSEANFSAVGRPSDVLSENSLKLLYNVNAKIVSCQLGDGLELKQIVPVSSIT